MENAGNELTLKLLIDKKSDKVLFGEASKDVVDFIFSLLALPLGAVTKLLTKDRRLYLCSGTIYRCAYVSEVKGTLCPYCDTGLNTEVTFVDAKSDASSVVEVGNGGKVYVKGVVTFSVMDDLTVVPMSTISSITLLNKFQIKDLGSLQEKTVSIGFQEGLKLVMASLETKTVLTDVFLKKNHASI
ncbi:uncharacterized protein LOC144561400 [Carex rostrata]